MTLGGLQSDATSIHIGNVAGDRFIQITPVDVFTSLPAMSTSKNISICPLACLSSLAIFEIFLPHCEALCLRPDRCMFECSQVRLVDMSSKRLQTVRCQRRSSLFEQFTKHIAVVVTSGQEGDCPRRYGRSCPRGTPLTAFAFCVFGCTSSLEKKKNDQSCSVVHICYRLDSQHRVCLHGRSRPDPSGIEIRSSARNRYAHI